ncbi:Alpha-2C adrenergic receptor [Camponotus japonicus]
MMPLLGSIMTIAVDNPTTASTSVLEGNMTWSRPISGGSTFSSNEAHPTRAIPYGERQTVAATSDRVNRLHSGGGAETEASENAARNNEKYTEGDERGIATGRKGDVAARKEASHHCGQTSETRVCGRNTVGATKSGETSFIGEENVAGIGTGGGGGEQNVDGIGSTNDSISVSTGVSNSTEEGVAIENGKGLLLFGSSDTMEDTFGPFNDSFNASHRHPWNNSLHNETMIVLGESLYPSGYTLPHIILASILATLLMIVIVVGNMLVIIAIATEKALKNIQNWFIASLAVADFFLGLVIMPFSLANEIMGYWIFGYWWCDIYSAMDVLLCTASIMNLCLISLDRFWSITQAVDYLKKRTPARAALMIALVWLLSALVCIPPLLGWKRPTPAEEYPKCKVSRYFIKH